jgi:hypothetical protein
MTTPRNSHTATLLPDQQVLVAGGNGASGLNNTVNASAELYDPTTGVWTATGSMATARGVQMAALLTNGHVLVAGGGDSSGVLASAELYLQPTANLAVSPTSGVLNQTIMLTGTGYGPNETVTIRADSISASPIYAATTDATGAFAITRHVLQDTYGSHSLIALGQSSHHLGVTTFSITPLLVVTPRSGSVGTPISVEGFGFGDNEQVNLYWYNPHQQVGSASTSSLGSFYGSAIVHFTIPSGTPAGQNVVYAVGQTSHAIRTVVVNVQ